MNSYKWQFSMIIDAETEEEAQAKVEQSLKDDYPTIDFFDGVLEELE